MRVYYDAVVEHDREAYTVRFPQLPEALTWGASWEEVAQRAIECVELCVSARLDEGMELPTYKRQPDASLLVAVSVAASDLAATRCMSVTQAAECLGVSPSRVCQLLKTGALQAETVAGRRLVTIESVNARLACPPAPHRPKAKVTATA